LLKAFAEFSRAHPAWRLVILGDDGPGRLEVGKWVTQLGLDSKVRLLHSLSPSEVAATLASAQACVQASLGEGLPLAVLEAGATRCPVVLSDVSGHDEVIRDGVEGSL